MLVCVCVCVCVQTVPYISPRWHSVDTLTPLVLILEHSNCEGRGQRVIPLVSIGPNISSELPFIREKLIPSYSGGGRHEDSAAEVNTFITAWPPLEEGISARWWGRVGCFLAGVWQQGVTRLCVCVCVCVCVLLVSFIHPGITLERQPEVMQNHGHTWCKTLDEEFWSGLGYF